MWSGANQFLEQAVEVRIVVETKIEGDVFYQRITCNQYKLGLLYLFLIDVLEWSRFHFMLEQTDEMVFGQTCLCSQFVYAQAFVDVVMDI